MQIHHERAVQLLTELNINTVIDSKTQGARYSACTDIVNVKVSAAQHQIDKCSHCTNIINSIDIRHFISRCNETFVHTK